MVHRSNWHSASGENKVYFKWQTEIISKALVTFYYLSQTTSTVNTIVEIPRSSLWGCVLFFPLLLFSLPLVLPLMLHLTTRRRKVKKKKVLCQLNTEMCKICPLCLNSSKKQWVVRVQCPGTSSSSSTVHWLRALTGNEPRIHVFASNM